MRVPLIKALSSLPTPNDQVQDLLVTSLKDRLPKVRIEAAIALGALAIRNHRVRAFLDQGPSAEGVFNTLWELVVGE